MQSAVIYSPLTICPPKYAEVVELADAPDSKSGDGDIVRVQVPPSAPPKHTQKERTNISESVCFSLFLGFFAYFFSLLPCFLFSRRQLLSAPKLGSHCTKRIFFALPLYEKDFFALRLNKKDFLFNYNNYNILIYKKRATVLP